MKKKYDPERTVESYELEWRSELPFDKFNLDEEFELQPQLYMEWGKLYALSRMDRVAKESELERVKGQVDMDIRHDPYLYGLEENPKEAAIKYAVLNNKRVIRAERDFLRSYQLQYCFEQAIKAFEQRKELLRAEGELWRDGYYSKPSVRKALDERSRSVAEREKIREHLGDYIPERRRKLKDEI